MREDGAFIVKKPKRWDNSLRIGYPVFGLLLLAFPVVGVERREDSMRFAPFLLIFPPEVGRRQENRARFSGFPPV